MKSILGFNKKENSQVTGFEFLNENEMQNIRGGGQPTKPVSRPREVYDFDEY